ncbi:Similar to hypothetical protein [Tuber melanosporum Mel28]; acc. no. XP_002838003 [Pyronema omphalodes CBS 100304]|uniref:Rho-GAP domain-containing protein n=1 Tax=Pyronema omphalodes (strain CBS 100304) TaxID=1076935 RepID=U4L8J5_PYROM|nr:Similar to hypothetical protein [Tuber melanosporum Mel28]; acc. no. XP_002838003 [Pyronema omphalodes CBS 100304]
MHCNNCREVLKEMARRKAEQEEIERKLKASPPLFYCSCCSFSFTHPTPRKKPKTTTKKAAKKVKESEEKVNDASDSADERLLRESASASAVKKKSSLKPKASMAPKKRVELLRQVTEDLPQANRNVLQFVIFHLDIFPGRSEENLMNSRNVFVTFQFFLRNSPLAPTPEAPLFPTAVPVVPLHK